jgi:hypothetical protein
MIARIVTGKFSPFRNSAPLKKEAARLSVIVFDFAPGLLLRRFLMW